MTSLLECGQESYLRSIWSRRYFVLSLVRMDLRLRYRRSILGMVWSLLNPLLMTAVLCFAFKQLLKVSIAEYGPFLLVGLAFWQFFTNSLHQGCHCLLNAEPYIRQHPAPAAIYPLRATLGAMTHHVIALAVAVVLAWAMLGYKSFAALFWLLPALALILMLGWALATLAGFLNCYFPDTSHLLDASLQFLYYLTPIMYAPGRMEDGLFKTALRVNPLGWMVQTLRMPILEGRAPGWWIWLGVSLFVALFVGLAIFVLARCERTIVFKI